MTGSKFTPDTPEENESKQQQADREELFRKAVLKCASEIWDTVPLSAKLKMSKAEIESIIIVNFRKEV